MNIWNKVFLGVIIIAAIAVIVLASLAGSIQSSGLKRVQALQKQIADTDAKIAKISSGSDATKSSIEKQPGDWGMAELRSQMLERADIRGRAWFGCQIRSTQEIELAPDLMQVEAQVIITSPIITDEQGVETGVALPESLKGSVYVFQTFDKKDESGNISREKPSVFLGRFGVSAPPESAKFQDEQQNEKDGYSVTLISLDSLTAEEIGRVLDAGQSKCAIYAAPPIDQFAGIFGQNMPDEDKIKLMAAQSAAELSEEEKKKLLEDFNQKFQARPAPELTEEDKGDAGPQTLAMWEKLRKAKDDPQSDQAVFFPEAFDFLYRWRSDINRSIEITNMAIDSYKTANKQADAENESLENDCIKEESRAAAMKVQLKHVEDVFDQYETEHQNMIVQIEKLQALQTLYYKRIEEAQIKAAEKIDRQIQENMQ